MSGLAVFSALTLWAAGALAGDRPTAREGIEKIERACEQAVRSGDASTLTNFCTKDAASFKQHATPVFGREALVRQVQQFATTHKGTVMKISIAELHEVGDWAYAVEVNDVTFPDGKQDQSRWLEIYTLYNGVWRMHREMGITEHPHDQTAKADTQEKKEKARPNADSAGALGAMQHSPAVHIAEKTLEESR